MEGRREPDPPVILDAAISLDGFVAGPNDSPERPYGEGGESLRTWRSDEYGPTDDALGEELGAVVTGKRTFDNSIDPSDVESGDVPVIVVTHDPPSALLATDRLIFVTEGVRPALERAKGVAHGRPVQVQSAEVGREALREGLVDEIHLHVVPVVLGSGRRLFVESSDLLELEQVHSEEGDRVTHLIYRVRPGSGSFRSPNERARPRSASRGKTRKVRPGRHSRSRRRKT